MQPPREGGGLKLVRVPSLLVDPGLAVVLVLGEPLGEPDFHFLYKYIIPGAKKTRRCVSDGSMRRGGGGSPPLFPPLPSSFESHSPQADLVVGALHLVRPVDDVAAAGAGERESGSGKRERRGGLARTRDAGGRGRGVCPVACGSRRLSSLLSSPLRCPPPPGSSHRPTSMQ